MDGGRVLRALLAIWLGYTRATRVAASIGQGLAVVFGFLGLMGNPLLVLVAVFIFLAASGEAGYVQAREYTRGYLASHAMITVVPVAEPALHGRRCRGLAAAHHAAGISRRRWRGRAARRAHARGAHRRAARHGRQHAGDRHHGRGTCRPFRRTPASTTSSRRCSAAGRASLPSSIRSSGSSATSRPRTSRELVMIQSSRSARAEQAASA